MTPAELLRALRLAGIAPSVRDGRLRLDGPVALLDGDLVREARQHRGALLAMLAEEGVVEVSPRSDCNSATAAPITGQVPERNHPRAPVAAPVAGCCGYEISATADDAGKAGEAHAVAVAVPLQQGAPVGATAITGQVPERNRPGVADCCTVAVDPAGSTITAPPGALDAALVESLRSHKADVLALLAPEPADDLEATALLGEVFWARQDAARSALAGAPDGGTRIATYRAAIARWGGYLDGLADQGPGRDALESAAIGQLRRLQRGEVVPREQEAIA